MSPLRAVLALGLVLGGCGKSGDDKDPADGGPVGDDDDDDDLPPDGDCDVPEVPYDGIDNDCDDLTLDDDLDGDGHDFDDDCDDTVAEAWKSSEPFSGNVGNGN